MSDSLKPCYNCPDREIGCHSKCQKEDYLKMVDYHQRVREGRADWQKKHGTYSRYE